MNKKKSLVVLGIPLLIVSNLVSAQNPFDLIFKSEFAFVSRFNDTGITWAGKHPTGNHSNSFCLQAEVEIQDCHYGRDIVNNDDSDGHAGFSFTKLDSNGGTLSSNAVQWTCVKDNVTGLTWETKTNDGGIHDQNTRYRWGGITSSGYNHPDRKEPYFDDWDILVNTSNNENFCGANNWRVPKLSELMDIADFGIVFQLAIELNYFPTTDEFQAYWASSPKNQSSDTIEFDRRAWSFFYQNTYAFMSSDSRRNYHRVRLVHD